MHTGNGFPIGSRSFFCAGKAFVPLKSMRDAGIIYKRQYAKVRCIMFTGFPEETMQFFLDIRFHNDKIYFNENRARYERDVKAVFYAFIDELADDMRAIDPLMEVRPYKCLSRINRDTRFSKDKSPYRDHLWLCFRRAAEQKEGSINFFFELGPSTLGWGLGTWDENRPMMEIFRRRMAADPEKIAKIIHSCHLPENDLAVMNRTWKRMDIPEHIPLGLRGWYASKEVYIGKEHPDMGLVDSRAILEQVRADFKALSPLYHLLRGAYEVSTCADDNVDSPKPTTGLAPGVGRK